MVKKLIFIFMLLGLLLPDAFSDSRTEPLWRTLQRSKEYVENKDNGSRIRSSCKTLVAVPYEWQLPNGGTWEPDFNDYIQVTVLVKARKYNYEDPKVIKAYVARGYKTTHGQNALVRGISTTALPPKSLVFISGNYGSLLYVDDQTYPGSDHDTIYIRTDKWEAKNEENFQDWVFEARHVFHAYVPKTWLANKMRTYCGDGLKAAEDKLGRAITDEEFVDIYEYYERKGMLEGIEL